MGAVMHSKPILLTQQGTTDYVDNVLTFKNRDDLIVYGSTQGILHVMRAGHQLLMRMQAKYLLLYQLK